MDLLLLRLIADWPPGQDPARLVRHCQDAAAPLRLDLLQPPRPYWKSDEQVELQFSVSPAGDDAQRALAARAADGWDAVEPDGEASRVWNRRGAQVLLHPAVRWAELGRVPAAASPRAT